MNDNDRNYLTLKNPWLIQSGYFKEDVSLINEEDINGIDDILYFNYMGSSEFQFGALPSSLRRMTINGDFYQIFAIPKYQDKDGNVLKVYAPSIYSERIKDMVDGLINNRFALKESCYLSKYISINSSKGKANKFIKYNEFWWDIENDYFIFFKHEDKILKAMDSFKRRHYGYPQNDFKVAYSNKKRLEFSRRVSNYQLSIVEYQYDLKNQIHFLKFGQYYSFLKILMDAFLIARINKGEVRFNYNGFNFKINENTTLNDIMSEYDIPLDDYCFLDTDINALVREFKEEEVNTKQKLVQTLSLVRDKRDKKNRG